MKKLYLLTIALLFLVVVTVTAEETEKKRAIDWSQFKWDDASSYADMKIYEDEEFSKNFNKVPASKYQHVRFDKLKYDRLPYASLPREFYHQKAFTDKLKEVPTRVYNHVKWQAVDFSKVKFRDIKWEARLPPNFHTSLASHQHGLDQYCKQVGQSCLLHIQPTETSKMFFNVQAIALN